MAFEDKIILGLLYQYINVNKNKTISKLRKICYLCVTDLFETECRLHKTVFLFSNTDKLFRRFSPNFRCCVI